MDLENPVIKLCVQGTQAEFEKRPAEAARLYQQAWHAAQTDYERCIAAHYVARCQTTMADILYWNLLALQHATQSTDPHIQEFYPSLYVNLGHAYEQLGQHSQAHHYYKLAADLGLVHHAPD